MAGSAAALDALSRAGVVRVEATDQAGVMLDVAETLGGRVSPWETLRPKTTTEARSWSLSGCYGMGAFPWHTDGAIDSMPPRYVVLRCVDPGVDGESTEVFSFGVMTGPTQAVRDLLIRIVLEVQGRNGKKKYFPALRTGIDPVVRWDPRICAGRPRSIYAEALALLEETPATHTIRWEQGLAVVIDNWNSIHRRLAVNDGSTRTLERAYIYQ